ncbi:hypothetical protein [uncultured Shewanella sp.]|uniref:hypothetical protein n=1 Tax=uncultured Shewanella sp. TaxID=173975 RepID=UPI00262C066B|nr:hypothetical protein [uncultured Shewanella sp.]
MSCSNSHTHPDHIHGPHCGHTAIRHEDHICYVHGGQLHQPHEDHYHDHIIEVTKANPDQCIPTHDCGNHVHGPNCGHEAIPHGDHIDYLVNGRLHHVHNGHCDDHGPIEIVKD